MAINRDHCKQLPSGEDLIDTVGAAQEYKATPQAFAKAAKTAGLKRFATRTAKGQVGHMWLADEVEALARHRCEASLVVDADAIVEAPYDGRS